MEDRRVRGAGSRSDHHLGTGGTPGTGPEAGDREQRGTAARLLRRENRRKSYVAAGRQNPGWAAAVPGCTDSADAGWSVLADDCVILSAGTVFTVSVDVDSVETVDSGLEFCG